VVEDFSIEDFCEWYGMTGDWYGSYYVTDICPVAGRKHVDSSKTGFRFDGRNLGFHCFNTACDGYYMSVSQVIQLLNQTHEHYPTLIWEQEPITDLLDEWDVEFDEVFPTSAPAPKTGECGLCHRTKAGGCNCTISAEDVGASAQEARAVADAYNQRPDVVEQKQRIKDLQDEINAEAPRPEPEIPDTDKTMALGGGGTGDGGEIYLMTIRACDVVSESLEWLWKDRIPKGKITWLAGKPDCGKSVTLIDIVARVTTGADFPDGTKNVWGAREVLVGVSEDGLGDTVVPRLIAAGADLNKVHLIQFIQTKKGDKRSKRLFQLSEDLRVLKDTLKKHPDIILVALDPITGYFGDVDSNKDREIRPVMDMLSRLCDELRITFLAVMHQNKRSDVSAVQKILGASSVAGSARTAWGFSRDPEDKTLCHMSLIKNNLSNQRSGMDYRTVGVDVMAGGKMVNHPVIEWLGDNDLTADEQMDRERELKKEGGKDKKIDKAVAFLTTKFAQSAMWKCTTLYEQTEAAGTSVDAIKRAKAGLGIQSTKMTDGWWWIKPEAVGNIPDDGTM
jgi:putative DNA primase/helicase